MENQLLPQIATSVDAAYELSNLLLSQFARMTQMGMAHTKQLMILTQSQISSCVEAKTPEEAMAKFNESMDGHVKNITEFGTDLCELGLSFQSEDAQFVESHASQTDATFQHLFDQVTSQSLMGQTQH